MMRRNKQRQAGFTLIELLVVISIIAVLMGLLISAVMKVFSTNPRTESIARLKGIDAAIGTFKADRFSGKGYIPAGRVDINPSSLTFGQVIGPFRLRNSYTATTNPDVNSFEAQYISQVFGTRVNLADLGNAAMNADLDANQTLLFFLGGIPVPDGQGNVGFTGFSNNPQQPFTPASAGETRKGPFLDNPPRKMYETSGGFARLVDGYGNPFAYFTAFNGKTGTMGGWNGTIGNAQPYANGGKAVNDTGWQIISAGQDKIFFGTSNNWSSLDGGSMDNVANFSTKILGAGPTAQ